MGAHDILEDLTDGEEQHGSAEIYYYTLVNVTTKIWSDHRLIGFFSPRTLRTNTVSSTTKRKRQISGHS